MEEVASTPLVVSDVRVLEVSGFLMICPRAWVSGCCVVYEKTSSPLNEPIFVDVSANSEQNILRF